MQRGIGNQYREKVVRLFRNDGADKHIFDDYDQFRHLVINARKGRRMTVNELAMASGLNRTYISRLEEGKVDRPQRGTVCRLCDALDINPEAALKAAGWPDGVPLTTDTEETDYKRIFTKMLQAIEQVHKICRTHKSGQPKPYIACPWCGNETRSYDCAWGYNDHVHFHCEHCGNSFMQ